IAGQQVERVPLIQGIPINVPKITQDERKEEAKAEAQDAQDKADAKLEHFGKFPLGTSEMLKGGFAIPTPKYSTHSKNGNVVTVNAKPPASAEEIKDFYAKALAKYGWQAAGGCWEKTSIVNKKVNSLCLQASNNAAVLTLTEK